MKMMVSRVCLLLLLYSTTYHRANGYPTGAGHCLTGAVIGNASNGQHGDEGNGSLEDGAFQVRVGTNLILDSENPTTLIVGESYSISLASSDSQSTFRGFLFRLSGINGENVQEALVVTDTSQTKMLPSTGEVEGLVASCAPGVSGLTHTSREDKLSISSELMIDATADVLLEVTVVTNNQGGGQNDWYYSSYELTITADDDDSPASTSSAVPTTITGDTVSPAPTAGIDATSSSSPAPSPVVGGGTPSPLPTAPDTGDKNTASSTPSTSIRPTLSTFPSATPSYHPSITTEPSLSVDGGPSSTAPSLITQPPTSSLVPTTSLQPTMRSVKPDKAPLYECKWWCSIIPTPWTSTDPDAYPKCDWTYSCSVCPECSTRSSGL